MMQFVVFSLLCQLLASAAVSAESTFLDKFGLDPIASTINEDSEGNTFFASANQESTRKQLIIKDFILFINAKNAELLLTKMRPIQKELNVTDEQLNAFSEMVTQLVSNAEPLVFSSVSNRSDQSFVTLRNDTEIIGQKTFKFYGTMSKTMNRDYVLQEFVDAFIETVESTLDAITQDASTRKPILNELEELRKNNTLSFVNSKETEIYHDLCKLDPTGNIFFQQATKLVVTRLAKVVRLIEQVKAKHHPDYVIMLDYYYGQLIDGFNRVPRVSCDAQQADFYFISGNKLMENDPIMEAFQRKLGIGSGQ